MLRYGKNWSGWYKNWFFNNIKELSYMVNIIEKQNLKWQSGNHFAIRYILNGINKTYFPSFVINNIIIECEKSINICKSKLTAIQMFCKQNNYSYIIVNPPILTFDNLLIMAINGDIKFTKDTVNKILIHKYKKVGNGKTILLTGFSGSGKTTLSLSIKRILDKIIIIDGDKARKGISYDLTLSMEDREIHANRISIISEILNNFGYNIIIALIAPLQSYRDNMKNKIKNFKEVYVKCSIEECKKRDPKGLYAKFEHGEISGLTGIDSPYEEPLTPNLTVETDRMSVEQCVNSIIKLFY